MKFLIKKILRESVSSKVSTGCEYFEKDSDDYRWCKFAENKLQKSTRIPKKAIERYKTDILSQFETGVRAKKYDKSYKFFSDRRSHVIDALDKFKEDCPQFSNYIIEQMAKFVNSHVILNENNEYDLLNKLNTNWSALSFVLTAELPSEYKTLDFNSALNYFFEKTDAESATTPFEDFMEKVVSSVDNESRNKIYQTIREKSRQGQVIEDEFFNYIKKYTKAIQYAGDYSFMDMIGVDMVILNPENKWVPVQVKKYAGGCESLEYRKQMCENWCVSYEKTVWKIRVFNGADLQKSKTQCKNLPLRKSTYLNVNVEDEDENQNSCEPKKPNLDNLDF